MSLIKSISDIKKYVPINKNGSMETYQPFVDLAEISYIISNMGIGQVMYDEINNLYQYGYPLTPSNEKLLSYIQRALAYYTMFEAAPFINVMVGDLGIQEVQSKEGTSGPASQWRYNTLVDGYLLNADRAMDSLLEFMEKNVSDYTTWANSSAFTIDKSLFFSTALDLSNYIQIEGSRSTYKALKPFISIAEEKFIVPCISRAQFDKLKSQAQGGYLTDKEINLINKIKACLSWLSLSEACNFLPLNISSAGIRVISVNDGNKTKLKADQKNIDILKSSARNNGDMHLSTLKKFIDDNVEDYPLYKESEAYTSVTPFPSNNIPENKDKSDFWV